jgi:hypothetical protein
METGKLAHPERITPAQLKPGSYRGTWSGYQICLIGKYKEIRIRTVNGVRGFVDCVVKVDEAGEISVLPNDKFRNAGGRPDAS